MKTDCWTIDMGGGKSAVDILADKSPTLTTTHYGTPAVICIEGNGSRPSHKGDGFVESQQMYTLNTTEVHAVCYGISPFHSNAMLSKNPNSGIYEAKTARTLDALQCGYPACNQVGMLIVERNERDRF